MRGGIQSNILFATVCITFLSCICSCATTAPGGKPASPEWLTHHPSDPQYFVGIGVAQNTGNREKDVETARLNAFNAVAEQIEITISSQSVFEQSSNSSQGDTSAYRQSLQSEVRQKLSGIEIVDSWFSSRDGYWYYVRLSKERWKDTVEGEQKVLADKAQSALQSVRDSPSAIERLSTLLDLQKTFVASPFATQLFLKEDNISVPAINLIETMLKGEVLSTFITASANPAKCSPIDNIKIESHATNKKGLSLRGLPVGLFLGKKLLFTRIMSDEGVTEFSCQASRLGDGKEPITIALVPPVSDSAIDWIALGEWSSTAVRLELRPIILYLTFSSELDARSAAVLKASFQKALQPRVSSSFAASMAQKPDLSISINPEYKDAPPNEYNIAITWCSLAMEFKSAEGNTRNFVALEAKGSGVTIEQARQVAFAYACEQLAGQDSLAMFIEQEYYQEVPE